ncbi:tRNA epoxyqueuosine(34) reductase QueG [candidate division KSB1 bacterium]|nr:tRNA epoxyqueuosine(34) reductase QueG [candidate division KSB1 bacterium]
MKRYELLQKIKTRALELGFDKVGVAKSGPIDASIYHEWLEKGFHGQMAYMAKYLDKRFDPAQLVPGAKSVISLAMNYYQKTEESSPDQGTISLYALGDDYHEVMREKMKQLLTDICVWIPDCEGRVFVDTAPIQDKYWAVKAGIGWLGKHGNVITKEFGSWVFLGEIVITEELEYDEPIPDYCGTCRKCLTACPTGAIVTPHIVDARKCISYWTIEVNGEQKIPETVAAKMGNLVFGCDICQNVCPWNKKFSKQTKESRFRARPHNINPALTDLTNMSLETFRIWYQKSTIKRAKLKGLLRNARIALQNKTCI